MFCALFHVRFVSRMGRQRHKRACTPWACPGTEARKGRRCRRSLPALRARPARSRPARPARGAKARIQTARGRLFIGVCVWKGGWGAEHVQPIEPSGSKTLQRRHVRGRARHFVRRYGAGRHVVDAGEDGHCWRDCLDVECCAMGLRPFIGCTAGGGGRRVVQPFSTATPNRARGPGRTLSRRGWTTPGALGRQPEHKRNGTSHSSDHAMSLLNSPDIERGSTRRRCMRHYRCRGGRARSSASTAPPV